MVRTWIAAWALFALVGFTSGEARASFASFSRFSVKQLKTANDPNDACATDLVKNSARYRTVAPVPNLASYVSSRLSPALEAFANAEEARSAKALSNFDSLLKDCDSPTVSDDVRLMAYFLLIGDTVDSHLAELFPAELQKEKLTMDRAAWAKLLPTVSRAETDILADAVESLFRDPQVAMLNDDRASNFDFLLAFLSLPKNGEAAGSPDVKLKDLAVKGLTWLIDSEARLGGFGGFEKSAVVLRKIVAGTPLSSGDRAIFVEFYGQWTIEDLVLNGAVRKIFLPLKITVGDVIRMTRVEARLRETAALSPVNRTWARAGIVQTCAENTQEALTHFPTEIQLQKAKTLTETIRLESLGALPAYFGDERKTMEPILEKIRFDLPDSEPAEESILIDRLRLATDEMTRGSARLDSKSQRDRVIGLLQILGGYEDAGSGDGNSSSYLPEVRYSCAEIKKSYSRFELDAYMNGDIYVGWQSVFWPEVAITTLAHEYGHAVSASIPKDIVAVPGKAAALACSHKNHRYLRGNIILPVDDSRFDEEDWADIFSGTVSNRLKNKGRTVALILASTLALQEPSGARTYTPELETSSETDGHSGTLGRAIISALALGEVLPASCLSIQPKALSGPDFFTSLQSCSVK